MGGVWGKWFLGLGALETGQIIYLVTLLISSLLSIGYLMPVVGRAYFRPAPAHGGHGHGHDDHGHGHDDHHGGEAPMMCVVPLCVAIGWFCFLSSPTHSGSAGTYLRGDQMNITQIMMVTKVGGLPVQRMPIKFIETPYSLRCHGEGGLALPQLRLQQKRLLRV